MNRNVAITMLWLAAVMALLGWLLDAPPTHRLLMFLAAAVLYLVDLTISAQFGERVALISFTSITACIFLGMFISYAYSGNWIEPLIVSVIATLYCVARCIGVMANPQFVRTRGSVSGVTVMVLVCERCRARPSTRRHASVQAPGSF